MKLYWSRVASACWQGYYSPDDDAVEYEIIRRMDCRYYATKWQGGKEIAVGRTLQEVQDAVQKYENGE